MPYLAAAEVLDKAKSETPRSSAAPSPAPSTGSDKKDSGKKDEKKEGEGEKEKEGEKKEESAEVRNTSMAQCTTVSSNKPLPQPVLMKVVIWCGVTRPQWENGIVAKTEIL